MDVKQEARDETVNELARCYERMQALRSSLSVTVEKSPELINIYCLELRMKANEACTRMFEQIGRINEEFMASIDEYEQARNAALEGNQATKDAVNLVIQQLDSIGWQSTETDLESARSLLSQCQEMQCELVGFLFGAEPITFVINNYQIESSSLGTFHQADDAQLNHFIQIQSVQKDQDRNVTYSFSDHAEVGQGIDTSYALDATRSTGTRRNEILILPKLTNTNTVQYMSQSTKALLAKHEASQTKLATRMRRNTSNVIKCSYCGKVFSSSSEYHRHERTHTGERPFKCTYCEKTFVTQGNCQIHECTHTGDKPCECAYCGKAFATSGECKRHERTHTGERPFKCTYCDKAFVDSGNCKSHERTHTGEKPFKCNYCDKAFARSTDCKAHERRKHRLEQA